MLALDSQTHRETVGERGVRPAGSEVWVSDNQATGHISNNSRNVYDCVDNPPDTQNVLTGDGKEMRVLGAGS